jgi:hypothetical protein
VFLNSLLAFVMIYHKSLEISGGEMSWKGGKSSLVRMGENDKTENSRGDWF